MLCMLLPMPVHVITMPVHVAAAHMQLCLISITLGTCACTCSYVYNPYTVDLLLCCSAHYYIVRFTGLFIEWYCYVHVANYSVQYQSK